MVSLVIERKGMDMAYVCLASACLPGIHTTVTLAVQRPTEFLLMKISITETERKGVEKKEEERSKTRHK